MFLLPVGVTSAPHEQITNKNSKCTSVTRKLTTKQTVGLADRIEKLYINTR